MTLKMKLAAACAGLLLLALAWNIWPHNNPGATPPSAGATDRAELAHGDLERTSVAPRVDEPVRETAEATPLATATTGDLVVHVRCETEPEAAIDLLLLAFQPGGDFRVGVHRARTDAEGTARFVGLSPGPLRVQAVVQPDGGVAVDIAAGATHECTLQLPGGMSLAGLVVDPTGVPVAGAIVEALFGGMSNNDAQAVTTTAADGTFRVRQCHRICLIGARARGFSASQLQHFYGEKGSLERVRIELRPEGGVVEGIVVDPTGRPVAHAVVRIGEGKTESILATPQGAPPLPAQVITDPNGRFVAVGVPAGTQVLQARARGLAPWLGTCVVAAGATSTARIVLTLGITCTGVVRGEDGEPVAKVNVAVGERGDFVLFRTRTAADGTFALDGLPVEFVLSVRQNPLGQASARLTGQPGDTVPCVLTLSNGLALRGLIVDAADQPIRSAEIRCEAEGDGVAWRKEAFTDQAGRFLVPDCPPARRLTLRLGARDYVAIVVAGVDPAAGEQTFVLARDTAVKARLTGRLLRLDGSGAGGQEVEAVSSQTATQPQRNVNATVQGDGSFVLEVPAGKWQGRILAKGHPDLTFGPMPLAAGAVVDLGTLQFTLGGTLLVRNEIPKADYLVVDAREHFVCGLYGPVPPLRSELIAPGDYTLLVSGEGLAAQGLPFSIRADQETELAVPRPVCVRQQIEYVVSAGAEAPNYVSFHLRHNGKLLAWLSAQGASGKPLLRELWLAPGDYRIETLDRTPTTTTDFTVGATEGPLLRIPLR